MAEKRKLAFYIRLSDADESQKQEQKTKVTVLQDRENSCMRISRKQRNLQVLRYWNTLMTDIREQCSITEQNLKLIQDAELGRFECIIVKDFSRFGGITLK